MGEMQRRKKVIPKESSVIVEPKIYWVALKLQKWDNLKWEYVDKCLPFPIEFQKPDNGEIGFIPVFSKCEDALKYVDYDKNLIGQIREVER